MTQEQQMTLQRAHDRASWHADVAQRLQEKGKQNLANQAKKASENLEKTIKEVEILQSSSSTP